MTSAALLAERTWRTRCDALRRLPVTGSTWSEPTRWPLEPAHGLSGCVQSPEARGPKVARREVGPSPALSVSVTKKNKRVPVRGRNPMTGGVVTLRETPSQSYQTESAARGRMASGLAVLWCCSPPFSVSPSQGDVARAADCIPFCRVQLACERTTLFMRRVTVRHLRNRRANPDPSAHPRRSLVEPIGGKDV